MNTNPGIIPTFAWSALITPGQFGPIIVQSLSFKYSFTLTISLTGIPSVIVTITLMPASAASMIASAANAGGTNMIETLAPASLTASDTVLNTGLSKCV